MCTWLPVLVIVEVPCFRHPGTLEVSRVRITAVVCVIVRTATLDMSKLQVYLTLSHHLQVSSVDSAVFLATYILRTD